MRHVPSFKRSSLNYLAKLPGAVSRPFARKRKSLIWNTKQADDKISLIIRESYGCCMFPGCPVTEIKELHCSHFIGRARMATRFYKDNLIALCFWHHYGDKLWAFEYHKQRADLPAKYGEPYDGNYTKFMNSHLGEERFTQLILRSGQTMSSTHAIIELMDSLGELKHG